jgi:hypothetical protein
MPLEDLSDLAAPDPTTPSVTVAQMCVTKMISTPSAPMPPIGLPMPPAALVTAFAAWVDAGAKGTGCAPGTASGE